MRGLQTPQTSDISTHIPRAPARLRKRAEFLAVAKGRRLHSADFSLQAAPRTPADEDGPRFGLTVTKKEGNAVVRNRLRRRLREALRVTQGLCGKPGHDYVIVARRESLTAAFGQLQAGLAKAIAQAGVQKSGAGPRKFKETLAKAIPEKQT